MVQLLWKKKAIPNTKKHRFTYLQAIYIYANQVVNG